MEMHKSFLRIACGIQTSHAAGIAFFRAQNTHQWRYRTRGIENGKNKDY
jgi:hypothetical protein